MKAFVQARIWDILRKTPNLSAREIAEAMHREPGISNALQRMRVAGVIGYTGSARKARWFVTGPKPEDHRGCHVNSWKNLDCSREECIRRLRYANKALGRDPDNMGRYKPRKAHKRYTGALEQYWKMPFPCRTS